MAIVEDQEVELRYGAYVIRVLNTILRIKEDEQVDMKKNLSSGT